MLVQQYFFYPCIWELIGKNLSQNSCILPNGFRGFTQPHEANARYFVTIDHDNLVAASFDSL
jgi:hypothetical protein